MLSTGIEVSAIVGVQFSLVDGFGDRPVINRFDDRRCSFLVGARGASAPPAGPQWLHNGWDKNDSKDAQVILHMLKIGATQVYCDPICSGINDIQELSKTHEVISKAKTLSAIDPDRYIMTRVVEAQRNEDASTWSPTGHADPLTVRRRRSWRAQPAATRKRTIATCCDAVARQTQAKPARLRLRPPNTKCPITHSDRGTATAPPSAGSFPAGFRTAAPVPAASSARTGIRIPHQERTCAQLVNGRAMPRAKIVAPGLLSEWNGRFAGTNPPPALRFDVPI